MKKSEHKKKSSTDQEWVNVDMKELKDIIERARSAVLSDEDHLKLKAAFDAFDSLALQLGKKGASVHRLRKLLFGPKSEKTRQARNRHGQKEKASSSSKQGDDPAPKIKASEKPKGHGRNPSSVYKKAKRHAICHEKMKPGDPCPECLRGKVYRQKTPSILVRLRGQAPISADLYELERLRCNLCGEVFVADKPSGVGDKKVDETAASMIALLKYGTGLPFYRLGKLQSRLGVPLPSSTQWDILQENVEPVAAVYEALITQAAQGHLLHDDDTTIKILSLIKENRSPDPPKRTGMFTTGIVSEYDNNKIVLFLSGRNYAGENLARVLWERKAHLADPLLMCDGLLSRNLPKGMPETFKLIVALCLAHCRRHYLDVIEAFPEECLYVLEQLSLVYKIDAEARKNGLTSAQRLALHQEKSKPVMDDLKVWLTNQFKLRKVEPNSSLGDAIDYTLDHWNEITRFLHIEGAPLDNNICERALKMAIILRKNSLFFKTVNGANVSDVYMSTIYTADLAGINPFDYLTALMKNNDQVALNPASWLPWNYSDQMEASRNAA